MDTNERKEEFSRRAPVDEASHASIIAAFQTRKERIYNKEYSPNNDRWKMREYMRSQLEEVAKQYVDIHINEDTHMQNISIFAKAISDEFQDILKDGKLRIGIAQKALNLYLKYLWCHGKIKEPQHCPFDRIIINKLYSKLDKQTKIDWVAAGSGRFKWTETDEMNDYKAWVKAAKEVVGKDQSIAEWELIIWGEAMG